MAFKYPLTLTLNWLSRLAISSKLPKKGGYPRVSNPGPPASRAAVHLGHATRGSHAWAAISSPYNISVYDIFGLSAFSLIFYSEF